MVWPWMLKELSPSADVGLAAHDILKERESFEPTLPWRLSNSLCVDHAAFYGPSVDILKTYGLGCISAIESIVCVTVSP